MSLYVPLHRELPDHPKTKRAAHHLGISLPLMVGYLTCLWAWAVDYAPDGDLSPYEDWEIADAARFDGEDTNLFVSALADCGRNNEPGFLEHSDGGYVLHDWEQYGGRIISRAEKDRLRHRKDPKPAASPELPDTIPTPSAEVPQSFPRASPEPPQTMESNGEKKRIIEEPILSDETPDHIQNNGKVDRAVVIRGRFEHWKSVFPDETRRMTLTKDRQRAISGRLREGIAAETIDQAVSNARADPWWSGSKDGEWKADIKTICGKGSTVEKLANRIARGQPDVMLDNPSPYLTQPDPTPEQRQANLDQLQQLRANIGGDIS